MKFSELIEHAIVCIKGFNPVVTTIDSHADEFIAQVSLNHTFFRLTQFLHSLPTPTRKSLSNKCSTAAPATLNSLK